MMFEEKSYINVFHFIFVFALLFYVGYENGINKKPINENFAKVIIAIACIIFAYHLYLFLKKNDMI
jgi:hypothetical protein